MFFVDRQDAGRQVASRLSHLRGARIVVIGIPRGGIPVAAEVARALRAPLDVCLVRKLPVPLQPGLAMGAIGEGGIRIRLDAVVRAQQVTVDQFAEAERRARAALDRMAARYRGGEQSADLRGRTVVVVDDGLATGITAQAACRVVRTRGAGRVILALPVAPRDQTSRLYAVTDELVCVRRPREFIALDRCYARFPAVTDDDVIEILEHAAKRTVTQPRDGDSVISGHDYVSGASTAQPSTQTACHAGGLAVPQHPLGTVVALFPAGCGQDDPRIHYLLRRLQRAGLATLTVDSAAAPGCPVRRNAFDIPGLGRRLLDATQEVRAHPRLAHRPIGYLVTGTGAAAAIWATAEPHATPAAIVAYAGRPDLAGPRALAALTVPTLLLVGAHDTAVLDLNQRARTHLRCENRLVEIPSTGHVLEHPRTLALAADLTSDWFTTHLTYSAVLQRAGSRR